MSTHWRRHGGSQREIIVFVVLVLAFLIAASVTLTGCEAETEASDPHAPHSLLFDSSESPLSDLQTPTFYENLYVSHVYTRS
ncbi:hypothetical protein KQI63_10525 [bacterium]|nr:hypothetical protein [bacterium]